MKTRRLYNKILTLVLVCIMTMSNIYTAFAYEYPTEVNTVAQAYVIYDADTGEVILEKDMNSSRAPASITKIMTALVVCENITDWDEKITFTEAALSEMTGDSSHLPIKRGSAGESMSVKDMLYGMFLCSANECAAQLGIKVAGSTAAFAEMMNAKAAELGCTGTHFNNAHGLDDDNHYSTPLDMAKIFQAALKNKTFKKMATTVNYKIAATNACAERECQMGHKMVNGLYDNPVKEVFAGKTGYTVNAGRTLVTAAKFDTHTVITVIMGSTEASFYNDTYMLLEYARGYYEGRYTGFNWEERDEIMRVKVSNSLSVRDYPCLKVTNVVGALYDGEEVHVVGIWGKWAMIEQDGATNFVYIDYLVDKSGNAIGQTTIAVETVPGSDDEDETQTQEAPTQAQTIPEDIYALGESTTVAPENDKKAGLDITTAIIMILFIIVIAVVVIVVIIKAAVGKERTLYREYYKDNDNLYYEDPEDDPEPQISEEDELLLEDDELGEASEEEMTEEEANQETESEEETEPGDDAEEETEEEPEETEEAQDGKKIINPFAAIKAKLTKDEDDFDEDDFDEEDFEEEDFEEEDLDEEDFDEEEEDE